ncbi:MAG: class II SORL domain-containing protein [Bacteroidetes bacterium]|nr:class II SORL domain-containing protein [Bacteroidota bacterium]
MKKKLLQASTISLLLILIFSLHSLANETSVKIDAPEKVEKGSEVTIKIEVTHSGNNFLHHTNWVWVKVNDKEYKKWEYGGFSKPEEENFTLEFTLKIDAPTTIEAKGNCNLHGSKGLDSVKIEIK